MHSLSKENIEIYNELCSKYKKLPKLHDFLILQEEDKRITMSSYDMVCDLNNIYNLSHVTFSKRINKFFYNGYKDYTLYVVIDVMSCCNSLSSINICVKDNDTGVYRCVYIGSIQNDSKIFNINFKLLNKILVDIISYCKKNKENINEKLVINKTNMVSYYDFIFILLESFEKYHDVLSNDKINSFKQGDKKYYEFFNETKKLRTPPKIEKDDIEKDDVKEDTPKPEPVNVSEYLNNKLDMASNNIIPLFKEYDGLLKNATYRNHIGNLYSVIQSLRVFYIKNKIPLNDYKFTFTHSCKNNYSKCEPIGNTVTIRISLNGDNAIYFETPALTFTFEDLWETWSNNWGRVGVFIVMYKLCTLALGNLIYELETGERFNGISTSKCVNNYPLFGSTTDYDKYRYFAGQILYLAINTIRFNYGGSYDVYFDN